jgi:hypothetical protein
MKKKKYFVIVIMLVFSTLGAMQVSAHPPQDMVLDYDKDTMMLDTTITHIVDNPNSHYIFKVEIEKNDVPYDTYLYENQPNDDTFTYQYTVEADVGDEITVSAFCSIGGSITRSLIVTGENQPPSAPDISGKANGNTGTEYEYTFNAIDPDDDNVKYIINWGDGDTDTTSLNPSGTDVKVKHTWDEQGNYIISVKAEDSNGLKGPESTLEITMPKNKAIFNFYILNWIFERFSNIFPILKYLI